MDLVGPGNDVGLSLKKKTQVMILSNGGYRLNGKEEVNRPGY